MFDYDYDEDGDEDEELFDYDYDYDEDEDEEEYFMDSEILADFWSIFVDFGVLLTQFHLIFLSCGPHVGTAHKRV